MIINVTLLLDLTHYRAAASLTRNQTREGEVAPAALGIVREASIDHVLNALPKFDRHKGFVPTLNQLAVPFEPAGIEPVAQDGVDGTYRHLGAALGIGEARRMHLAGGLPQRNVAARVPFEQLGDQGRDCGIGGDDLLAVRPGDVAIAERRLGRPDALLGLLLHALACFLGQVVDVVLRHQHLDAVHELFRGARLARQHHAFLREVHLDVKFVHRHPIQVEGHITRK
jgi:hypothetical protein